MGKFGSRVLALGFLMAASAGVALPATAHADPDPVLSGDCASTLGADGGKALTIDAGAAVDKPGALAVGTGSDSANDPAAHLDVADAAKALHVNSVPGTDAVRVLCADAQGAVNNLSATTQTLLGGEPAPATPPTGPSQPPTTPAQPVPEAPDGPDSSPDLGGVQFLSFPLDATSPLSVSDLSSLIPPVSLPPAAEGVTPPTGTTPAGQDSGSAQALPASSVTPARLPLLLAAIALALAGAALAHTWLRRRPL
ncbi:hypothetical protein LWP59_40020 [Amycolatopsis acidiphila]|uniref:Uncharacterized protein n=1 Tax=Amycolatopsis acidiphila TaxID=715473 RepID=A0A558A6R4_9PSEU|nr:hypothetical protein [Amycolatopsis acidiphila]TVT19918.1 hypothetical protein FNH06_22335 [Amycolatopsis acidiphila]UIJ60089.1 hypothetical protein LWP59_40020 [Amycolatopsis acidiphila]GHG61427.1 hypothetical protein GCM10017788_16120 [Amycolatopsis acidiphila]